MYPHIKQEMTEHLAGMMSLSQPINDNMSAEQKNLSGSSWVAEQGIRLRSSILDVAIEIDRVVKNEKEEFKWFKLATEQREC